MYFWHKYVSNVKIMTKSFASKTFLVISAFIALSAQAVNISEYRIYLDEDNRNVSFVIFNRESSYQDCALNLIHNSFDVDSNMQHLPHDLIPENSAQDWIRFSPREFVLTPAQTQTVRFTMRRKANAQDGEFRSYLLIDCGVAPSPEDKDKPTPQVNLQTKLIHSVPIIVRSGKLQAEVWFDNIKFSDNLMTATLNRKGTRSVYGDVELIHKKTGELVSMQRNFSIYPESDRFHLSLGTKNYDPKDLKIRFTENKKYGGNIILETDAITTKH